LVYLINPSLKALIAIKIDVIPGRQPMVKPRGPCVLLDRTAGDKNQ
jgi:hypothetical protein